jgi:hypothetical protein
MGKHNRRTAGKNLWTRDWKGASTVLIELMTFTLLINKEEILT